MFDGNPVKRKEINLSGVSTRRTSRNSAAKRTNNKSRLLETARIQREERRLQNLRNSCAIKIQSFCRGYFSRSQLLLRLEKVCINESTFASTSTTSATASILSTRIRLACTLPHHASIRSKEVEATRDIEPRDCKRLTDLIQSTICFSTSLRSSSLPSAISSSTRNTDESLNLLKHSLSRICSFALWILATTNETDQKYPFKELTELVSNVCSFRVGSIADLILLQMISSPSTGPNWYSSKTKVKKQLIISYNDRTPPLLFVAMRNWFWKIGTAVSVSPDQYTVAITLLTLSSRSVKMIESSSRSDIDDTSYCLGLFAASILSAQTNLQTHPLFSSVLDCLSLNEMAGTGEKDSNAMVEDQTEGNQGYISAGGITWLRLIKSITSLIISSSSDNDSPNFKPSTSFQLIENTVAEMIHGREMVLVSNAIDLLCNDVSGGSNGRSELNLDVAATLVPLIYHMLRVNPNLCWLVGIVAQPTRRGGIKNTLIDIMNIANQRSSVITKSEVDNKMSNIHFIENEDGDNDDDSEFNDEDENGDMEVVNDVEDASSQSTSLIARSSSSTQGHRKKMSRSELLTTKGIDTLVHKSKNDACQQILDRSQKILVGSSGYNKQKVITPLYNETKAMLDLAIILGDGSTNGILMKLGRALMGPTLKSSTSTNTLSNTCLFYCKILHITLQCSSGFRTRQSPLLSTLAFSQINFSEHIWKWIGIWKQTSLLSNNPGCELFPGSRVVSNDDTHNNQIINRQNQDEGLLRKAALYTCAMTTFCDVLSQKLIIMDDEKFADELTSVNRNNGLKAIDLVGWLSKVLRGLYWEDPVLKSHIFTTSEQQINAQHKYEDGSRNYRNARVELFLSGTKLWNSLYVRWTRMSKSSPFCNENLWWWPRITSQSIPNQSFGGLMGANESGANADVALNDGSAYAPMDVDDDSDDDGIEHNRTITSGQSRSSGSAVEGQNAVQDEEDDVLASSFRDPKMARVLTGCPQALPFERRVSLFNSLLSADKAKTQDEMRDLRRMMMAADPEEFPNFNGREQVRVRRDHLFNDSMNQLNSMGSRLRKRVQITFINQHGTEEPGIDGGGVFKEFLDDLIKDAFDPGRDDRLFSVSPMETLFVNVLAGGKNPSSQSNILAKYEFLGRVLGKALYESILVEPQFCLPFLQMLLGKPNTLDDLKHLDTEFYRHLRSLRKMENVSELGLTFEITSGVDRNGHYLGGLKTVDLCAGGASMEVHKTNFFRYLYLVAHHKLNVEGAQQTKAFLRGFRDIIPASWVRLFSANELQKLISGDDAMKGIDVEGLRKCMVYAGGYHTSQPMMIWFWEVIHEMTSDQQCKFLRFMTSCSRQPLLGFEVLVPLPCVQQVRSEDGSVDSKLPTAATCANLLKLPLYGSKQILKEKLLYAVESGAGFELT